MRRVDGSGFVEVVEATAATLRYLSEIGLTGFDVCPETLQIVQNWGKRRGGRPESLSRIQRDLGDCTRCRLSRNRRHIVFGTGNPAADLVFVGEGPGRDEDRQGMPFVGAAGKLLTKIIQAMNLTRDEVYICNVVKCRPPSNRNPAPDEIKTCFPFLLRQIASIGPGIVCALGTTAAQTLLSAGVPISKMRGRFHIQNRIRILPTYHPAYLLRNPDKKREVWEDMQKIMQQLNRG